MLVNIGAYLIDTEVSDALFSLAELNCPDLPVEVEGPQLEVNGQTRTHFNNAEMESERDLPNGGREVTLCYTSLGEPDLVLRLVLRGFANSPLLRFRYMFTSAHEARLTKKDFQDALLYFRLRGRIVEEGSLTEIQLSQWDALMHTYQPAVETFQEGDLYSGQSFCGPIMLAHTQGQTLLMAYEHGAQAPTSFLAFELEKTSQSRSLSLCARLGNYYHNQPLGESQEFRSVWFELALAPFPLETFLPQYRASFFDLICENNASRQPLLYYNSWNMQERRHAWDKTPYLEHMNFERIAAEIDIAHRMGLDVFVIDTGWFTKTGDWKADPQRFPDDLREIKRKLDGYGMRLGLWFNPLAAAISSSIYQSHPEYEMTHNGRPYHRAKIWETEESAYMCLASGYADFFINTMVRYYQDYGVTYFKWDAMDQYGCNSPLHNHGTEANSSEERADCYAYQMGNRMVYIVEQVTKQCPDVIVDFDVTEGRRFVGLGFLSVGRYFLINNGSYITDFDLPIDKDIIDLGFWNVFFHPGAARPRVVRRGSLFDEIIPSSLFLIHYLPDAPRLSQVNSMASLALGGNGIWGDLAELSDEDIAWWAANLSEYKRMIPDLIQAYPRRKGSVGSSPEIHEKINPESGNGLILFFTVKEGCYTYMTQALKPGYVAAVKGAEEWQQMSDGRLKITVKLGPDEARLVYVRKA